MLYGVMDDGTRILPKKNTKANCPHCKNVLIPKCGKIKIHHWSHKEVIGCPYSYGMTPWHYNWLTNFDGLLSHGWEIEFFFGSIRFDAYNLKTKQAIEFQRIIDIDYIDHKIKICQESGIKLFWLINPDVFKNYAYTDKFIDNQQHTLFALRACKRKITFLLEKYMNNKSVTFLIDFRKENYLPKYSAELSRGGYILFSHEDGFIRREHPMKRGIYIIHEKPILEDYQYRNNCVLFLKYHETKFNFE